MTFLMAFPVKSIARVSVATLLFVFHCALSQAQEQTIEEVEVVGRQVNLVGNASSASEGLVSHAELEIRPLLRTGEIMETVPGMVATQHSGSGKANQYFLRGFNLDHGTDFATYVDSMPVNMRTHGHGQGYTDLNFVIPEMVEEIFYQKGSYYANMGDFSGSGGAHIRSLEHLKHNRVTVNVGEDQYKRVLLLGAFGPNNQQTLYGIEMQRYDGPWTDIQEDADKKNIWLKQHWQSERNSGGVALMVYDNSWNSADQIPQRAITQNIIDNLGSIDTTVGGDSSRYSLSASWLREGNDSQLQASAYVIDYEMNLFSNFSYFTDPAGDQFRQVDDRKIFGWDAAYSYSTSLGNKPLHNTFGTQFRYDQIDRVGLLNTQARQEIGVTRVDAVNQWSNSLYWQGQLQLSDVLRLAVGLRYDYFDFDVNPLRAGDPSSLAFNGGSADDDIVTGSLGLSYQVNSNLELYGNLGQGFHSNDARGTTIAVEPTDSASMIDSVDPLVATFGYEFGVRAFFNDKLNASFALWHLDVDSELIFVGDEGVTEDTGDSSNRDGLEIALYYYLNDGVIFDLEYSYTDAQFDHATDGLNDIPGALETVISAGVFTRFNSNFYGNLRLRHFGDYPLDGGQTASSSTMANLRLAYEPNNQWSFTLDVLNLFDSDDHDVEYFYESQLPGETAAVEDFHFHVFEPRNIRFNVSYEF